MNIPVDLWRRFTDDQQEVLSIDQFFFGPCPNYNFAGSICISRNLNRMPTLVTIFNPADFAQAVAWQNDITHPSRLVDFFFRASNEPTSDDIVAWFRLHVIPALARYGTPLNQQQLVFLVLDEAEIHTAGATSRFLSDSGFHLTFPRPEVHNRVVPADALCARIQTYLNTSTTPGMDISDLLNELEHAIEQNCSDREIGRAFVRSQEYMEFDQFG